MSKSAILDKIRKLASMTTANGCTESEAKAALSRMEKMMLDYDIAESEVQEEISEYVQISFPVPRAVSGGRNVICAILNAVADAYNVKPILQTRGGRTTAFSYFGTKRDTELAKFFFDTAINYIKASRKEREEHVASDCARLTQAILDNLSDLGVNFASLDELPAQHQATIRKAINDKKRDMRLGYFTGFAFSLIKKFDSIKEARNKQAETHGYGLVKVDELQAAAMEQLDGLTMGTRKRSVNIGDGIAFSAGRSAGSKAQLNAGIRA